MPPEVREQAELPIDDDNAERTRASRERAGAVLRRQGPARPASFVQPPPRMFVPVDFPQTVFTTRCRMAPERRLVLLALAKPGLSWRANEVPIEEAGPDKKFLLSVGLLYPRRREICWTLFAGLLMRARSPVARSTKGGFAPEG